MLRVISAIVIILFFVYTAASLVGGGKLFKLAQLGTMGYCWCGGCLYLIWWLLAVSTYLTCAGRYHMLFALVIVPDWQPLLILAALVLLLSPLKHPIVKYVEYLCGYVISGI
jgi:hypothetical protein